MEKYESIESPAASGATTGGRIFTCWVILTQALGLLAIVLVAALLSQFRGGFQPQSDLGVPFNYHPLLMVIGMVVLYGNGILAYRVFRGQRKLYVKLLHASLHVLALIFAAVGLKAVFDSHNLSKRPQGPIPNLYSVHSWLGLTTAVLFALQWVGGVVSFLKPGLSHEMKVRIMPLHVFFGLALFLAAVATAISGITEIAVFHNKGYEDHNAEGTLQNILGIVIILFAVTVVYVVTRPYYQRPKESGDERMQLSN